jgi:hypothetical protein
MQQQVLVTLTDTGWQRPFVLSQRNALRFGDLEIGGPSLADVDVAMEDWRATKSQRHVIPSDPHCLIKLVREVLAV